MMSRREGIAFQTNIVSDSAPPLWSLVNAILDSGAKIKGTRDPTRGGVAAHRVRHRASLERGNSTTRRCAPCGREVRGACDLWALIR